MTPGQRIGNRFEVEREAGAGAMGIVFRAKDLVSGEPVALKILSATADRARFEREAHLLAELDHPGIVRYVAHGESDRGTMWLAMEWLEGEELKERLQRRGLTAAETIAVVRAVAEAIGYAHARGVVHRDLKPSNLWLERGDLGGVKVLDFGIAFARSGARATQTGAIIGTPAYMAPEQARGARDVDARADVFSLGCVAFHCLTGRPPFIGDDMLAVLAKIIVEQAPRPSDLVPDVPEAFDELVASLLAKSPAQRPADGSAVVVRLAELATLAMSLPDTLRAPRSRAEEALTNSEQRFTSVIVLSDAQTVTAPPQAPLEESTIEASMLSVVSAFSGRIELLVDGSIMVLLPGGGAATDQATRAAACALLLREQAPQARMAVATGRAEVGVDTPVGEAIDRAVKLLRPTGRSEAPPAPQSGASAARRPIRIDEITASLLDERFECLRSGSGLVLVGHREADSARTLLGIPTPCVGREAELATLEAVFSQCVDERVARVVVVTAPAGVGKSRLRYELLRRLSERAEGLEVWVGRGDPVSTGSPFGLAAQMIRRTADVLEGEPLDVRRDKLRARVARHVPEASRARVTSFLAELIGAGSSAEDDPALRAARADPRLMGDQIRQAWSDFVGAASAATPLVIVLEDLHWGDRPTITLVDDALRLAGDTPLFVVAFARPEVDALVPDLWKARAPQRLALAPLPRRASERLVRSVLGDRPRAIVEEIVEHAGGNAFFLEELIRFEAEGRGREDRALPETVVAMVQARLEGLDADSRRLLRAASVFGQVFWEDGAIALLGEARDGGSAARLCLEELVRTEVVSRRPSKFAGHAELVFRHALVREAAYASLTGGDRALGHRLAAGWLEKVGETDPAVLAGHHEEAGDQARAAVAWRAATDQALGGNDLDGALRLAARGIQCGAEGDARAALFRAQADVHMWRGDSDDSARCATEAMRAAARGSDLWVEAAVPYATAAQRLGRPNDLARVGEEVCFLLHPRSSTSSVTSASLIAAACLYAGLGDLADRLLGAVERTESAVRDATARACALQGRAGQALLRGDTADFLRLLLACAQAYEEATNVRRVSSTRLNIGLARIELGDFAEATEQLVASLAIAERLGLELVTFGANQNLGWAMVRQGRLDEGRRLLEGVAESFAAKGDRRLEGSTRIYLADAHLQAGDSAAAEREASIAAGLLETAPRFRPYALALVAQSVLARGRAGEALDVAAQAMELLESGGVEEGEGRIRLAYVEALDAAGHADRAREALGSARARLLARAAAISDPRLRTSFLQCIPEHARTLALGAARLAETAG